MTDTTYGVPGVRDAEGGRKPVDHTFEFDGQEITIKFIPPTVSEYEDFETLEEKDEVDPDELEEMLREYLVKPEISENDSFVFREMMAFFQGIVDYSTGASNSRQQEVIDEIQARQGGAGN